MKFEVPLLPSQQIHDRMQSPYFWQYMKSYTRETGKDFIVSTDLGDFTFVSASADEILDPSNQMLSEESGLTSLACWVREGNYARDGYGGGTHPYRADRGLNWIIFPDGTCAVSSYITGRDLYNLRVLGASTTRLGRLIDDRGDWELFSEWSKAIEQIFDAFEKAWKRSRQRWKRQQKKSGALALAQAAQAEDDAAELHSAKLEALAHCRTQIALLASHMEDIANDRVSVASCREVFDSQNNMTSINARLKKALKLK
jgi:hypothetical protein